MFQIQLQQDEDRVTYVPDYANNRDLADEWVRSGSVGPRAFFWVELLTLSGRDYNKISGRSFRKSRGGGIDFMAGAEALVRRIIKDYVPEVGGLSLQLREKTIAPKTGEELYDELTRGYQGLGEIIDDIFEALKDISKADAGDLKKLQQLFGGSEQPTINTQRQETGGAVGATRATNTPRVSHQRMTADEPATAMR